ncbi:hypothetical protein V7O66_04950 [Methanolobus sp. ZRKC3]
MDVTIDMTEKFGKSLGVGVEAREEVRKSGEEYIEVIRSHETEKKSDED